MAEPIVVLWEAIRATLVEMGDESVCAGYPFGLRGYPDFHRLMHPGSFPKTRCTNRHPAEPNTACRKRSVRLSPATQPLRQLALPETRPCGGTSRSGY